MSSHISCLKGEKCRIEVFSRNQQAVDEMILKTFYLLIRMHIICIPYFKLILHTWSVVIFIY